MFRKMTLVVALLATLLLIATNASSQANGCNCANASLVGDTVGTRFNLGPGPINSVVASGIEMPAAGPPLGSPGPSPRWSIDFGSDTIRVDFLQQPATYGMGSYFTFSGLDPQLAGCPPAFISGITVTTNKPTTLFNVVSAATFGPHTVTIQIAPTSKNLDWQPGEFILVKLNFACDRPSTQTAVFAGRVLDNNRRPVSRVQISLKGKVVGESETDGSFLVTLAGVESRVALTFAAEGYVSNTRVYDSKATGNGNTVVIWPIAYRVKFDSSRELDIELGSSRIKIPANVLTGPGGEKLNDPVALQFTLFDITNQFQRAAASGDFSGQLLDGSIRRLNSYGIFDFDLRDFKGRPLNLSRGARMDLSIAIPPRLAGKAPKQVGFFDFDAKVGRWIQVGNFDFAPATLSYNGSVTSFGGSHNLDDPQDTTCVTVQVVNMYDGSAMPNFSVTAHGPQYDSQGTTNSSGFVCLLVQRNASFSVDAWGMIGTSYFGTPNPPTFTSPNFSSGAADCGSGCTTCPFLGTVQVDLIVGTGDRRFPLVTNEK
jgi:hypothetical protein